MIRIVLDSNILISALFWDGNERNLLVECRSRYYRSITSYPIITEVEGVLRKKFGVPEDRIITFAQSILLMSDLVIVPGKLDVVVDDPKDNKILETAVVGDADFLITGDNHLLKMGSYEKIRILKASDMLEM